MAAMAFGKYAGKARFRQLAAAGASLGALIAADPAFAQCATSTAGGITSLTCADTVTTNSTNSDGSNPSTSAYNQQLDGTINANFAGGVTISGFGMRIAGSGGSPITVTNNGNVSNTAGVTDGVSPGDGLDIEGSGGLVTYQGNGNVTSNAAPTTRLTGGLVIGNTNLGGVNIGSQAAPITATFRGQTAVLARLSAGGDINAYFHGGTMDGTRDDSLELSSRGNVNLVMTGNTVMTRSLYLALYSNALTSSRITAETDAAIGTAAAPTPGYGVQISLSGQNTSGASFALTGTGSIFSTGRGIQVVTVSGSTVPIAISTAAGTAINTTGGTSANGIEVQSSASTISLNLAGALTSTGTGLFVRANSGATSITIAQGATVTGSQTGLSVRRTGTGTAPIDILNLGTISAPGTAATFDGTLRIGNGGTSGSIAGNVTDNGSLIFDRSDAVSYGGIVSGTGTLTKQGAGTLTLTGASTYGGATAVNAGALIVNGSLAGAVTVANGARLGGSGSIGGLTIAGELAPGGTGAIGTLTVNGNLAFNAGSSFIVDIGNGVSDRVNVSGTAALGGGVAAFAVNGAFTAGTYTLLNAAGGISGTFSPLTTSPNAAASLRYDANNVFLEVTGSAGQTFSMSVRQSIAFTGPTVTTNRTNAFST